MQISVSNDGRPISQACYWQRLQQHKQAKTNNTILKDQNNRREEEENTCLRSVSDTPDSATTSKLPPLILKERSGPIASPPLTTAFCIPSPAIDDICACAPQKPLKLSGTLQSVVLQVILLLSDRNGALWKFFTGGLLAFLFSTTKSNTLPSSFCYSIEHESEKTHRKKSFLSALNTTSGKHKV